MLVEPGAVGVLQESGFNPEMLFDEGRRAATWAMDFFRNVGQMPTQKTLEEEQKIALPQADEPLIFYVEAVTKRWRLNVIGAGLTRATAQLEKQEPEKALDEVFAAATRVRRVGTGARTLVNLADPGEIESRIKDYEDLKALGGTIDGIPTPWGSINEATRGIHPGELWVIIGAMKSGKSWAEIVMALYAWEEGRAKQRKVLLVSEEMSIKAISRRWDAVRSRLPYRDFRKGQLATPVEDRWKQEMEQLKNLPAFYVAGRQRARTVQELELLVEELNPDICFIDGAYFLETDEGGGSREKKYDRTSGVIDRLQSLVQRKGTPLVISWQFNRTGISKKGKKQGGGGEEDVAFALEVMMNADVALGLMRNETLEAERQARLKMLLAREAERVPPLLIQYDFENMLFGEVRAMAENEDTTSPPTDGQGVSQQEAPF
jgi:hypothetical protein